MLPMVAKNIRLAQQPRQLNTSIRNLESAFTNEGLTERLALARKDTKRALAWNEHANAARRTCKMQNTDAT